MPNLTITMQTPIHSSSIPPAPSVDSGHFGSIDPLSKLTSGQQKKDTVDALSPNTIIFGETGVGKSSIINLIAGQKLAQISNDALGCTFQHRRHIVTLDGLSCALWDTTGLNEGSEGTVPARQAESNLGALMRELAHSGGIHLVIYCIRGARLTKALKRNYELFYVTVCRKKVPVALVVTGLEHERDEMEAWWNKNETTLRRHNMRFDAHACVTTLDVQDSVIQERRSDSQRRLRELVVKFSRLPAWKTDPSFISRILPLFRDVLRRASATAKPKNTNATTVRKVVVCDVTEDAPDEFSPGIGWMGDGQYEFVRIDKCALQSPTPGTLEDVGGVGVGAGVLVFYTSTLLGTQISPTDLDALRTFYNIAGGQISPVIVVLRGCDDEEVARAWGDVALRQSDIHAHFVCLPTGAADGQSHAQAGLREMIERLCIEHVEVKPPKFSGGHTSGKGLITGMVEAVTSVACAFVGNRANSTQIAPATQTAASPST